MSGFPPHRASEGDEVGVGRVGVPGADVLLLVVRHVRMGIGAKPCPGFQPGGRQGGGGGGGRGQGAGEQAGQHALVHRLRGPTRQFSQGPVQKFPPSRRPTPCKGDRRGGDPYFRIPIPLPPRPKARPLRGLPLLLRLLLFLVQRPHRSQDRVFAEGKRLVQVTGKMVHLFPAGQGGPSPPFPPPRTSSPSPGSFDGQCCLDLTAFSRPVLLSEAFSRPQFLLHRFVQACPHQVHLPPAPLPSLPPSLPRHRPAHFREPVPG